MKSIDVLLDELASRDIRVALEGDRVAVSAPRGALVPELREELARRKDEVRAHLAERAGAQATSAIVPAIRAGEAEPSHMQKRLWFIRQMDPGGSVYNMSVSLTLTGRLDESAFEAALSTVFARHESLRCRFVSRDGTPFVIVEPDVRPRLERFDLSAEPPGRIEARVEEAVAACLGRPIDLAVAPLAHAQLLRIAADRAIFTLVVDHSVADGVSLSVIVEELAAIYAASVEGRPAGLPPPPVQYLDYVDWERREFQRGLLEEHAAYWRGQLRGAPAMTTLPTDRPRPPLRGSRGERLSIRLGEALSDAVRRVARTERTTPFTVLLAALYVLLHRHTGETDLSVGTVVANRNRVEVDRVVGFFANSVVLRGEVAGDTTVRELVARTRDVASSAFAHQAMPFDALVDALVSQRALDHTPLFQVLFVHHEAQRTGFELPGLRIELYERAAWLTRTARFDLTLDAVLGADGFTLYFEYASDLYDASTVERWTRHYRSLLAGMVADPEAPVGRLALVDAEEAALGVASTHGVELEYDRSATLQTLFERQVARTPDAVALVFEGQELRYAELNARANRLAHHLRGLGVSVGALVGIRLERSVEMVVAVLATIKAGAAYVPLDPAFPADRLDYMTADAGLAAVVTGGAAAPPSAADGGPRIVRMDVDASAIAACPEDDPAPRCGPNDLAYVIYTSGSTGRPKGVMLEHRSVVNFLTSMHREPGIVPSDRFVSVTTLSFDIAGLELHGPLTVGATVVLAARATVVDGAALGALLDASRATVLQATPATWRMLVDGGWRGRPGLRMLCGGEALQQDLARRLLPLGAELWNLYGPTETTIWSTLERVTDAVRPIAIGRPIANTQCHVLEPSGAIAPIGVPGELCIGGDGLARGYLGREALTAERFATVTLPGIGVRRLYRTGDVVRLRPDGRLQYVGRRDHQVKVRGFRIELGEIETVLSGHPGVRQTVVVVREDVPGDARLVAYVVPEEGAAIDADAVRGMLRARLPEYMVPGHVVALGSFPLTPNGKVDRLALPEPPRSGPVAGGGADVAAADDDPVMSPVQRQLAAMWCVLLGRERVGLHENFFDAGGHSLLLVRLQSAMLSTFGQAIPLVELFQRTTVAAQAERFGPAERADPILARARARAMRQLKR